jgi:hypothetical protein
LQARLNRKPRIVARIPWVRALQLLAGAKTPTYIRREAGQRDQPAGQNWDWKTVPERAIFHDIA